MNSKEYDEKHFKKIGEKLGFIFPKIRPWRWVKILGRHKKSGHMLDIGCGEGYFLQYAKKHYDTNGMDISNYCIRETLFQKSAKIFTRCIHKISIFDIIFPGNKIFTKIRGKAMYNKKKKLKY